MKLTRWWSGRSMATERRRSQRLPLQKPVEISFYLPDGTRAVYKGQTQNVSAHGALLHMEQEPPEQRLVAFRTCPGKWVTARVVRAKLPQREKPVPVAIELLRPSDEYWGVTTWRGL